MAMGPMGKHAHPARKLGEKAVFATRRFTVYDSMLRVGGRVVVSKPYIRQNACAEVLAITKDGKVLLVKSYRPEIGRYVYELPAGTLRKGEKPISAAKRELEEETGFRANRTRHMFSCYPLLGYSDCKLHFFLATGLEKSSQSLEKDESIMVRTFSIRSVQRMIEVGKAEDLCIIAAMHYYCYAAKGRIRH